MGGGGQGTLLILWLNDLTFGNEKVGHSMFPHSNADYKIINPCKHPTMESDKIVVPVGEDLNGLEVLHRWERSWL